MTVYFKDHNKTIIELAIMYDDSNIVLKYFYQRYQITNFHYRELLIEAVAYSDTALEFLLENMPKSYNI